MMNTNPGKLEWEDKYSVGVEEIDDQHKRMFNTINELISVVTVNPTTETLVPVIESLVEYKKFHFATEEKYFKELGYEGMEDHIAKHEDFGRKFESIQMRNKDDAITLTYELIDFLEDWLIGHLMTADQEYKECFRLHGLK